VLSKDDRGIQNWKKKETTYPVLIYLDMYIQIEDTSNFHFSLYVIIGTLNS
jgi:hypothetical protein